jgi:hypothetical protein
MAVLADDQSGTGGFITSGISRWAGAVQPQGQSTQFGGTTGVGQPTIWDQLLMHFSYRYPIGAAVSAATPQVFGATPQSPGRLQTRAAQDMRDERNRMQQDRRRLMGLAREAGLDPNDPVMLAELWTRAVREAEAAYGVDPRDDPMELVWEVLARYAKDGAPGTFKAEDTLKRMRDEYYGQGEPYEETRVDTSLQLTDPDTARELIIEAITRRVGREPTEDQLRQFVSALNAKERANPRRTTTVTRYAADGSVLGTSSNTVGGNVSPAAQAMGFEEEELEGEERAFTAGVTYAPVIDQLVGGY